MRCKYCGELETIKINKPDKVKFQCKNGHTWHEDYVDNGGIHARPVSYELSLEDILFPSEKILYRNILNEIEKNKEFYNSSNPVEITETLIKNTEADEKLIYSLMKKIVDFEKNKDNY